MGDIFLKLFNMSITAGWFILAVLCIRLFFRKIPKWVNCMLWGAVAVRLVCPFSIESQLSVLPSSEPIKSSTVVEGEGHKYIPSPATATTARASSPSPTASGPSGTWASLWPPCGRFWSAGMTPGRWSAACSFRGRRLGRLWRRLRRG